MSKDNEQFVLQVMSYLICLDGSLIESAFALTAFEAWLCCVDSLSLGAHFSFALRPTVIEPP